VGNTKHNDGIVALGVNEDIGKPVETTPAQASFQLLPRIGKCGYPFSCQDDLGEKFVPSPGASLS
jgi:hypothetical protein